MFPADIIQEHPCQISWSSVHWLELRRWSGGAINANLPYFQYAQKWTKKCVSFEPQSQIKKMLSQNEGKIWTFIFYCIELTRPTLGRVNAMHWKIKAQIFLLNWFQIPLIRLCHSKDIHISLSFSYILSPTLRWKIYH